MQQPEHPSPRPEKTGRRRGAFARFVRGYLMLVGAGTTVYVLIRLIILLLVEAKSWSELFSIF